MATRCEVDHKKRQQGCHQNQLSTHLRSALMWLMICCVLVHLCFFQVHRVKSIAVVLAKPDNMSFYTEYCVGWQKATEWRINASTTHLEKFNWRQSGHSQILRVTHQVYWFLQIDNNFQETSVPVQFQTGAVILTPLTWWKNVLDIICSALFAYSISTINLLISLNPFRIWVIWLTLIWAHFHRPNK